jgi:hypothetical protein
MSDSESNTVELIAPKSLGFGSGSDATIYFEIEFLGVNSEQFNMEVLQDIHIGVHGTPGYKNSWTVGWNIGVAGASRSRLVHGLWCSAL